MLVKDVAVLAAENLGRTDLATTLSLSSSPIGTEITTLLRCCNLIENEVALDYFPLKKEETFPSEEGKILYTSFSRAPVDVMKVTDAAGRDVNFELFPDHLSLPSGIGTVTVKYSYAPTEKKFTDTSEFSGKISARLLSYGVACEFSLMSCFYQQAAMWEKRFREALRAAGILRKKLCIRSRRWK